MAEGFDRLNCFGSGVSEEHISGGLGGGSFDYQRGFNYLFIHPIAKPQFCYE